MIIDCVSMASSFFHWPLPIVGQSHFYLAVDIAHAIRTGEVEASAMKLRRGESPALGAMLLRCAARVRGGSAGDEQC
jgi:hypothetical protein